jgi:hypothetical protein
VEDKEVCAQQSKGGPYGYFVENLFAHSMVLRIRSRWVWVSKGQALRSKLGFPMTSKEIEQFSEGAVRVKRILVRAPLMRSLVELVIDRDNQLGNERGQKRPMNNNFDMPS